MNDMIIRQAVLSDIPRLIELMQPYVETGVVLARDENDLKTHIRNFRVAVSNDKVIACVALRDFGNDLYEIRSLVVDPSWHGSGIGAKMVRNEIELLRQRKEVWKIFTLTTSPGFFLRQGFQEVDYRFPEKIWSDCEKCPRKDRCDEIALLVTSED